MHWARISRVSSRASVRGWRDRGCREHWAPMSSPQSVRVGTMVSRGTFGRGAWVSGPIGVSSGALNWAVEEWPRTPWRSSDCHADRSVGTADTAPSNCPWAVEARCRSGVHRDRTGTGSHVGDTRMPASVPGSWVRYRAQRNLVV